VGGPAGGSSAWLAAGSTTGLTAGVVESVAELCAGSDAPTRRGRVVPADWRDAEFPFANGAVFGCVEGKEFRPDLDVVRGDVRAESTGLVDGGDESTDCACAPRLTVNELS